MSKQIESNSRFQFFLIKSAACLFGLLLGFFILAPKGSMQTDDVVTVTNGNVRMMSNYKPTPEPPKSNIRGRVIYADTGRAVRRAGLMLMPAKSAGGAGRENAGLTNESGEFEIKNVNEGKYFVSVSTPGVVTPFSSLTNFERAAMQDSSAMADVAKDFQEVVVNGINDIDVTIVVKRGAAITGRIMYSDGEAAIGARVEVLRKKNGQYNAVIANISEIFGVMFGGAAGGLKTDDRGVFRIAGLPAGDYIVRVVENVSHSEKGKNRDDEFMAITGFNPGSMVATYYPGTSDVKKAEVIKVELGQEQPEVNITIPERFLRNLGGTVVNKATREPLKNARVSIKSADNVNSLFGDSAEFGSKNETDEQGRWNYKELPAGKYTLTVQPPYSYETSGEKNQQKTKTPKLAAYQKEIVIEEKDVPDFVVELGYGSSVSGVISVENGQNLPARTMVSLIEEEGKSNGTANIGEDYEDGSMRQGKTAPKKTDDFKIEGLPGGKFYFNISPGSSSGETEKKEEFYVKSILYGGRDITDSMLETKEGEELKGIQIVLSKDVGKIKGKVLNADKTPAISAKIYFVSTDKQKWGNYNTTLFASTGGDGEFETSGAPGEYFVFFLTDEDLNDEGKSRAEKRLAWLERETKDARKVSIKAKETEKMTLTLPAKP